MVDFVIIAQHHGVFLTLQSLLDHKDEVGKVVIMIPDTQVEKYEKIDEPIFKDFISMVVGFGKKLNANVFITNIDLRNPVWSVTEHLKEQYDPSVWLYMVAGSIFNGVTGWGPRLESMKTLRYGLVKARAYAKNPNMNMYDFIGCAPVVPWDDHCKTMLLINTEKAPPHTLMDRGELQGAAQQGLLRLFPEFMFGRPDELVIGALGALDLMAFNAKSVHSLAMNFWAPAMTSPQILEDECYHGYPLDKYASVAKKVKKYLPLSTYNNIIENGRISESWVSGLRELILD